MLKTCRLFKLAIFNLTIVAFVETGLGLAATRTVSNTYDSGPGLLRARVSSGPRKCIRKGTTPCLRMAAPLEINDEILAVRLWEATGLNRTRFTNRPVLPEDRRSYRAGRHKTCSAPTVRNTSDTAPHSGPKS
jgi:hypothetical protein